MPVVPPQPRYTVEDTGDRLRIVIPPKRDGYLLLLAGASLFLSSGSALWFLRFIVSFNNRPVGPPIWFQLIGLTWFICSVLLWLWILKGAEVIEVDQDKITRCLQVREFSRRREYTGKFIWNLRVASIAYPLPKSAGQLLPAGPSFFYEFVGLAGGQVAFEYFSQTVRFGASLSEVETRLLVETILQRFPQYGRTFKTP